MKKYLILPTLLMLSIVMSSTAQAEEIPEWNPKTGKLSIPLTIVDNSFSVFDAVLSTVDGKYFNLSYRPKHSRGISMFTAASYNSKTQTLRIPVVGEVGIGDYKYNSKFIYNGTQFVLDYFFKEGERKYIYYQ